jgi:hypothetical protein
MRREDMKYKAGDRLLYKLVNVQCEVVDIMEGVYKVLFPSGYTSNYGVNYVENEDYFISSREKAKSVDFGELEARVMALQLEEGLMKKEKKNQGYRFKVSSLHAVDVNRIERESLTKDNPVAILHSKGEFKVVVHDSLWMKGVWGVEDMLSECFEKAYHAVGGDFRPMDKDALETFLALAKRVKCAPWKNKEDREIRVDIPKL